MGDMFDGWDAVPASASWEDWRAQFVFMLMMGYGTGLSVGEQQVAAHLGNGLYHEGLNAKDACHMAIAEAQAAPASAKLEAANAFAKYSEQMEKDYPDIFGAKGEQS